MRLCKGTTINHGVSYEKSETCAFPLRSGESCEERVVDSVSPPGLWGVALASVYEMPEGASVSVIPKKNLIDALGFRVTLEMDDRSRIMGRLVSLSPSGNVILTDAERMILLRKRSADGTSKSRREAYLSVLFVRGSSVVSVSLTKGITTDTHVVDTIGGGGRDDKTVRAVQMANLNPSAGSDTQTDTPTINEHKRTWLDYALPTDQGRTRSALVLREKVLLFYCMYPFVVRVVSSLSPSTLFLFHMETPAMLLEPVERASRRGSRNDHNRWQPTPSSYEMVRRCNVLLREDPHDWTALRSRARAYVHLRRYEAAVKDWSQLLHHSLGPEALDQAHSNKDRAALREQLTEAFFYRGLCLERLNLVEDAICDLSEALALDATLSRAAYERAACYNRLEKFEEAIADYETALATDKQFQRPLNAVAAPRTKRRSAGVPGYCCATVQTRDIPSPEGPAAREATRPPSLDVRLTQGPSCRSPSPATAPSHCSSSPPHPSRSHSALSVGLSSLSRSPEPAMAMGQRWTSDASERGMSCPYEPAAAEMPDADRGEAHVPDDDAEGSAPPPRSSLGREDKGTETDHQRVALPTVTNEENVYQTVGEWYKKGIECRKRGVLEDAIKMFSKVIELDDSHCRAHFNRGYCNDKMNRFQEAVTDYQRAMELDPQNPFTYYNLGIVYDRLEEYETAIHLFSQAIAIEPRNPDFYHNRGLTERKRGDYGAAIDNYTKAIHLQPDHFKALYNRAFCFDRLEQFSRAVQDYTSALCVQGDNPHAHHNRGAAYEKLGMLNEAITDFSRAIELNPSGAFTYNARGLCYHQQKQLERALQDFNQAVCLQPSNATFLHNRGFCSRTMGQLTEALEDYTAALAISDDNLLTHNNRAFIYRKLHRFTEAIEDYSVVINRSHCVTTKTLNNRAYCHARLGHFEEAMEDYSRALVVEPRNINALYNRAVCYEKMNQYENAVKDYTHVVEDPTSSPNDVSGALLRRGASYLHMGRVEDARRDLERSISLTAEETNRDGTEFKPDNHPAFKILQSMSGMLCVEYAACPAKNKWRTPHDTALFFFFVFENSLFGSPCKVFHISRRNYPRMDAVDSTPDQELFEAEVRPVLGFIAFCAEHSATSPAAEVFLSTFLRRISEDAHPSGAAHLLELTEVALLCTVHRIRSALLRSRERGSAFSGENGDAVLRHLQALYDLLPDPVLSAIWILIRTLTDRLSRCEGGAESEAEHAARSLAAVEDQLLLVLGAIQKELLAETRGLTRRASQLHLFFRTSFPYCDPDALTGEVAPPSSQGLIVVSTKEIELPSPLRVGCSTAFCFSGLDTCFSSAPLTPTFTKLYIYFSDTYAQCREKFLAAAKAAGATKIENHLICSRDGEDYFLDTAFFEGKMKNKMLVHSSGTHGVEGYTGSAVQTKLLRTWEKSNQDGPSILFVHAINPYGMAHYRRFNENNVDLNRNYLTEEQWKEVKSRDPNIGGYETFKHVLSPSHPPKWTDKYWFYPTFAWAVLRHGFTALKRAFVTGQYHHPEGIYFGGHGEQPSVTTLRTLLKSYSNNGTLEDAIFIDVHSGLGPAGVDTIMCGNSNDAERAAKVFVGTKVQNDAAAASGPSGGYNLAAGIIRPRIELAGPTKTLSITEEFGTVPGLQLRMDVRDAFYPQNSQYKASVIKLGTIAFFNAHKHLML
eukprot:gene6043-4344_t